MVTTVGFGDYEALFACDRLILSVYVLFGTIIVGFTVSVIVEVSLNLEGKERQEEMDRLFKVVTHDDLVAADIDHDGSVDEGEFVLFKLRQMGVVSEEDIRLCQFYKENDDSDDRK